ncbi:MAG: hypothetical protein U5M51_09225 [Emticicia sp.]|nr:hypothetical protein [Emticicia sp.]
MVITLDQATFEPIHLTTEQAGDDKYYLMEGSKVLVLYYKGKPISIEHPHFIYIKVAETDPDLKAIQLQGQQKKLSWKRVYKLKSPLFIKKEGELLKIDTRTGDYIERAN